MNCKEFDNKISLYIDGELNSDQEKNFLKHSKDCVRCHRALVNSEQMMRGIKELNHIKAPEDLSKNVIYALAREEKINLGENDQENYNTNKTCQEQKKLTKGFLKQMPRIKKISIAAVLFLVLTSAVILSTDWIPIPMEEDMMVMESGEESATEDRALDESEEISSSMENGEPSDPQEDPGTTALENEEVSSEEESSSEEFTTMENGEGSTLRIQHGEWIVILLGIGVISGVMVLLKNRKS